MSIYRKQDLIASFPAYDVFEREPKAKKPEKLPPMTVPGVKVSMLQSWQRTLPAAVHKLGFVVERSGYEEGSTVWSVAFEVRRGFDIKAFETTLRNELQFSGWMKVQFFDLVE